MNARPSGRRLSRCCRTISSRDRRPLQDSAHRTSLGVLLFLRCRSRICPISGLPESPRGQGPQLLPSLLPDQGMNGAMRATSSDPYAPWASFELPRDFVKLERPCSISKAAVKLERQPLLTHTLSVDISPFGE